jgi:RHS repeat-associated protein
MLVHAQAQTSEVTFASDETWGVYSADPSAGAATFLGNAQRFCLNLNSPPACQNGAVLFGNPAGGGWNADLGKIAGAQWIWAPGITGDTARAALQGYFFSKQITLPARPATALMWVAVDDYARVFVNGQLAGETGSTSDLTKALAAQSALKEFNIAGLLAEGLNTITVFAQNGSDAFHGCRNCKYSQNSAGVVFGGRIGPGAAPETPPILLGDPGSPSSTAGSMWNYEISPAPPIFTDPAEERGTPVPLSRINTGTGNHFVVYRDLIYAGRDLKFNFRRFYNSQDPYTGPLGRGWTHTYNMLLRLNATTGNIIFKDADGKEKAFEPAGGASYTAIDPGVFEVLIKNGDGSFTITRPNQNRLDFSAAGKLLRIRTLEGRVMQMTYSSGGDLVQITDPAAHVFTLTYDASHRLTKMVDHEGRTLQYVYDSSGKLASFVDPTGGTTLYAYTASGQLLSGKQPNAVFSFTNTFDTRGRVLKQKTPSGQLVQLAYSAPTPPAQIASSTSTSTSTTSITDPLGRVTVHVYDSRLRLIKVLDATGGTTSYTYDEENNRTSVTDPRGNTTQYTYDSRGNLLTITNALEEVTRFTYDVTNNQLTVTDPLNRTTTYTYDERGNLLTESDPLGNTTRYAYDLQSNRIKRTDAKGRITLYVYDTARNLIKVTDALGGITRYTYDQFGNRTSSQNARTKTTSYAYDTMGRLRQIVDPLGLTTSFEYDALGNIKKRTDAKAQVTSYSYNPENRVISIAYSGGAVSYTYDAAQNRKQMAHPAGNTRYNYDVLNRVTSITDTREKAVGFTYDAAGNRTSVVYPSGSTATYSYDAANRLTAVTDALLRITTYTYNAADQVILTKYPSLSSVAFSYDGAGRLVGVANSFRSGSDNDSIPITSFRYTLDAVGNRVGVVDGSGQATSYSYDDLDQLIQVTAGSDTSRFAYDPAGNRTRAETRSGVVTYSYDAADRMLTAGDAAYAYDANGNRTSRALAEVTTYYAYDGADRLVSINSEDALQSFVYDGDGNRIGQTTPAGTYEYVNDPSVRVPVVLQEFGPDGPIQYLYGRALISEAAPGKEYYYLYDGLGSVVGLVDSEGTRRQRYQYDPWGTTVLSIPSPGVGTFNKFQFTGQARDPGSDLYYLRSRYYEPATGRFLSKDDYFFHPEIPLSLNRYAYVRNNPVKYIDPLGRDAEPPEEGGLFDDSTWPYFSWP